MGVVTTVWVFVVVVVVEDDVAVARCTHGRCVSFAPKDPVRYGDNTVNSV